MSKQELVLKTRTDLTVSQILRTYGKQFRQVTEQYSDGYNGRCAIGVLMSYYGWDGKDDSHATTKLLVALIALRYAGIDIRIALRYAGIDIRNE